MNQYSEIIKRFQAVEDELAKLRKQRNYELYNLDEENVPRLREYSKLISENQKAISLVEQNVSDVESSVTLLSQYVNESIVELETLTGQIDNELKTVKTNLATVETKADDAAASAELAAQSVTELESEVSGQIRTLTQNVASVKTTADSASASVSAIVKNVGSNGAVTAASIVAKINDAGSSVQISADHISLAGKTIALTADTIDITSTYFNVSTSGAVECTSLDVSGSNSSINVTAASSSYAFIKVAYASDINQNTVISPTGAFSYFSNYATSMQSTALYTSYNSGYAYTQITPNEIYCAQRGYNYPIFTANNNYNQVVVGGQFSCYGLKSRAEQTEHYRDRLMYAFETPNPLYGDFGRATIAEDGMCYIFLDPIFYECIDNTCDYYVFIQPEGEGQFTVTERASDHFKVHGTVGESFAWMLVTAQRGYSATRNEELVLPEPEPENAPNQENIAYDTLGDEILKEFKKQLG